MDIYKTLKVRNKLLFSSYHAVLYVPMLENTQGSEIRNRMVTINKLGSSTTDFDINASTIARAMTLDQAQIIFDTAKIESISKSWFARIKATINKWGYQIDEALYGQRYDSPQSKLGHKDACLLINKWVKGEIIIADNREDLVQLIASLYNVGLFRKKVDIRDL